MNTMGMRYESIRLRRMELKHVHQNTPILELPIEFEGSGTQVNLYANARKMWKWVSNQNLYGGYWRDADGTCYLPS